MTVLDHVRDLLAAVGQRRLILFGAAAVIRDEAGQVLLVRRSDTGE